MSSPRRNTRPDNEELELITGSARILEFDLTGVPEGAEVTGARLALKTSSAQNDEDAPLLLEVTQTAASSGQVTEGRDADGVASVRFVLSQSAMAGVTPGVYVCALRAELDSGLSVEVSAARRVTRVLAAAIGE